MTEYISFRRKPAVSKAALDEFLKSDADPLAKIAAAAMYSPPVPAKPGEPSFGSVGSYGGIEISDK